MVNVYFYAWSYYECKEAIFVLVISAAGIMFTSVGMNKKNDPLFAGTTRTGKSFLADSLKGEISHHSNGPMNTQSKNRCLTLKKVRMEALQNIEKLNEEAKKGDLASFLALKTIGTGHELLFFNKDLELGTDVYNKLRAMDYIDSFGAVNPLILESMSEEVYNECKVVFEEDEEKDL